MFGCRYGCLKLGTRRPAMVTDTLRSIEDIYKIVARD